MAYVRRGSARAIAALGSLDDPIADDFDSEAVNDPRADYVAWAAAVKKYGGYLTTMPHVNKGAAAAAYPVDVIYPPPDYSLNPIFHHAPDDWSADSSTGYYRAPQSVLMYTTGGSVAGINQSQAVPGEPAPPKPNWYDSVLTTVKYGAWIIGGLVALDALSFLPRGRR